MAHTPRDQETEDSPEPVFCDIARKIAENTYFEVWFAELLHLVERLLAQQ